MKKSGCQDSCFSILRKNKLWLVLFISSIGNYYWRYEPNCEHPVKKIYPKLIRDVWAGVPDNIDDAILHTNGLLYFLKGIRYWRFNDSKLTVKFHSHIINIFSFLSVLLNTVEYGCLQTDPGYPLLSAPEWFSCHPEP